MYARHSIIPASLFSIFQEVQEQGFFFFFLNASPASKQCSSLLFSDQPLESIYIIIITFASFPPALWPSLFFTSPEQSGKHTASRQLTLMPEMGEQKKGRTYHLTTKQTRSARQQNGKFNYKKNIQLPAKNAPSPPPQSQTLKSCDSSIASKYFFRLTPA